MFAFSLVYFRCTFSNLFSALSLHIYVTSSSWHDCPIWPWIEGIWTNKCKHWWTQMMNVRFHQGTESCQVWNIRLVRRLVGGERVREWRQTSLLDGSFESPSANEMSEEEHLVLPALLFTAKYSTSHHPDTILSFLSLRSLDDELPHHRRSRSPNRYYEAARGRHQEEDYLDERWVLMFVFSLLPNGLVLNASRFCSQKSVLVCNMSCLLTWAAAVMLGKCCFILLFVADNSLCSFENILNFLLPIITSYAFFGPGNKFVAVLDSCWQLVYSEFTVTLVGLCECVLCCVHNNEQHLLLLLSWHFFLDSFWFFHGVIHPHGYHSEIIMIHHSMRGKSAECLHTR